MELRKGEEELEEKRPLLLLPSKWNHGPGQPWVVPLRRCDWQLNNAVCNQAVTCTSQTFITREGSGPVSSSENISDHWSKE